MVFALKFCSMSESDLTRKKNNPLYVALKSVWPSFVHKCVCSEFLGNLSFRSESMHREPLSGVPSECSHSL